MNPHIPDGYRRQGLQGNRFLQCTGFPVGTRSPYDLPKAKRVEMETVKQALRILHRIRIVFPEITSGSFR